MKLYELKQLLEDTLEQVNDCIEEYGDGADLNLESNTYYVHSDNFLGIAGYGGGYLGLDDIEKAIEEPDDDEEDEDEGDDE